MTKTTIRKMTRVRAYFPDHDASELGALSDADLTELATLAKADPLAQA